VFTTPTTAERLVTLTANLAAYTDSYLVAQAALEAAFKVGYSHIAALGSYTASAAERDKAECVAAESAATTAFAAMTAARAACQSALDDYESYRQ
jgi:hypothetical protein